MNFCTKNDQKKREKPHTVEDLYNAANDKQKIEGDQKELLILW